MKGELAKSICPEFHTFYVKQTRGKADLTKYRDASFKIFDIITRHCPNTEKASIDEAYLDLTDLVDARLKQRQQEENLTLPDYKDLKDSFVVGTYEAHCKFLRF
jgi:DNA polymerase eta